MLFRSLYGLPIYHGRKVRFEAHDLQEARQVFIQRALVEAELLGDHEIAKTQQSSGKIFRFFWHNQNLIKQVEALEHRSRRQDVLVDDDLLFAFYDQKIPTDIVSRKKLEAWLNDDPQRVEGLILTKGELMRHEASGITVDRYPKVMKMAGTQVALTYHFEPGSHKDGVTMEIGRSHV